MLRAQSFGVRALSSGFRVLGFGFRVHRIGFRVSGFSGFGFQVSGFGLRFQACGGAEGSGVLAEGQRHWRWPVRKVDIKLPGKGNSMKKWTLTNRLSIKKLSLRIGRTLSQGPGYSQKVSDIGAGLQRYRAHKKQRRRTLP